MPRKICFRNIALPKPAKNPYEQMGLWSEHDIQQRTLCCYMLHLGRCVELAMVQDHNFKVQ